MNTKVHTAALFAVACGLAAGLAACHDLPDVPPIQPIPHTKAGVLQAAEGAFALFDQGLGDFTLATGVFTDELTTSSTGNSGALDKRQLVDSRNSDDSTVVGVYASLQNARVAADVAARSFPLLAPDAPPVDRGRMYAVQGYTEVMLADLFCSGVPLSSINLADASVVYGSGATRDSVYRRAVAHFDSTLALSAGNDPLMTLARVGKGRALLALGQFSAADQAVADVPDGARYQIDVPFDATASSEPANAAPGVFAVDRVADREGGVGLAYLSSHDPRTLSVRWPDEQAQYTPNKYVLKDSLVTVQDSSARTSHVAAYVPFVVADWVEARLIQAEAALHANDVTTWLRILNHLRATAPILPPAAGNFAPPITLTPLTDPGTPTARVDTMFAERAAWLYLTGHRQGDLRRLMRQYGRTQDQVYPNGLYAGGGTYGTAVVVPIPSAEQANPKFTGCLDLQP